MMSSINSPGADSPNRLPTDRRAESRAAPGQTSESQQTRAPSTIRTAADGIALLRARLDQQMADFGVSSSSPKIGQFEPPSAAEVSNRVLGFVENRLQQEAGADPCNTINLPMKSYYHINAFEFSELLESRNDSDFTAVRNVLDQWRKNHDGTGC